MLLFNSLLCLHNAVPFTGRNRSVLSGEESTQPAEEPNKNHQGENGMELEGG